MTKEMAAEVSRWQSDPTKSEVYRAYMAPQAPEHWLRISQFVLTRGFGVEPDPTRASSEQRTQFTDAEQHGHSQTQAPHESAIAPEHVLTKAEAESAHEFRITWPTPELEASDYKHFFEICKMVIATLTLEDSVYSQSVLPDVFKQLEQTYLFNILFQKRSESQNNTVRHHVETVPQLVDTTGRTLKEIFILRITAIFHDAGKAFNIGRDQVHYHALISSDVIRRFMEKYQDSLINHLFQFERVAGERIISESADGVIHTDRASMQQELAVMTTQISEMVRLHHVLEQIDKGVLDLETVAAIFQEKQINPLLVGLFVLADGGSVIPDNEKYAQFLIQNMNILAKLVDVLEFHDQLPQDKLPDEIKLSFAQALQHVLQEIIQICDVVGTLSEKIKDIIYKILNKLDAVFARALLATVDANSVPEMK